MADKEKIINLRVKAETEQAEKGLNNLNKTTTKAKTGVGGLSKGFAGMKAAVLNAVPALNTFKTALMGTGIGAIAVALGSLGGLFVKAGKKGAAFAKELSTLKAVSNSTTEEMEKLSSQAKNLGSTTQFTAMEVVKLQTELAKLGFTVSDIQNSTPAILNLASSLEVSLAESAEFAGSIVRSFGLTTVETARVVDVMALSTSSSALNFDALRESLKLVAPTSKATNVSLEETTSLLAVLADRGLKGSIAGTGLSKTFIELNKKGLSLEDGFEKVKNSANPLNTAIDLVGVVAGKTFLTLAEGADDLEGLEQKFIDAEGAAQRMADVKLDNLAGDTVKLESAWEGLLLRIEDGDGILNGIARGGVQLVTGAMSNMNTVLEFASHHMNDLFDIISNGASGSFNVAKGIFDKLSNTIGIFANKAKLSISEIPIIGGMIDVEQTQDNLKQYEEMLSRSGDTIIKGVKQLAKVQETVATSNLRFLQKRLAKMKAADAEEVLAVEKETNNKLAQQSQEDREAEAERIKKANEKAAKERQKAEKDFANFENKLRLDKENNKAKTDEDRLTLDRERRLKELEEIKLSEEEKRQAVIDVNAYYDTLEDDLANTRKEEKKVKDTEDRALIQEQEAERRDRELQLAQELNDAKMAIEDQYISHLQGLSGVLSTLAGENEALATAALVLEKGAAIANVIISTTRANQDIMSAATAKSTELASRGTADVLAGNAMLASGNPMGAKLVAAGGKELAGIGKVSAVAAKGVASNKLGAGISIAGIMATALTGGAKSAKGGRGANVSAGGGGGGGAAAPRRSDMRLGDFQDSTFDALGNEQVNREANAQANSEAQSNRPMQAYVTSGEVSTGNALERNRVNVSGF